MVILLLQAHREFQIVTPRTLAAFRGSTLILPDVRVLEDDERAALGAHVSRGVTTVVTRDAMPAGLAKPSTADRHRQTSLPEQRRAR